LLPLVLLHQPWLLLCNLMLRRQPRLLLFWQTSKLLQRSFLMPVSCLPVVAGPHVSRILLLPHPLAAGRPRGSSSQSCWRLRRSYPISHTTSQSYTGVHLMQAAG
jgi:hypothetical protein